MVRRKLMLLAFAALMSGAAGPGSRLASAIADPGRAAFRASDVRRHPADLVALAELQPGQRVLDLIPGDGYWTRIFSKMVGPRGRVYAMWPQAYARESSGNVQQLRDLAKTYPNVSTLVEKTPVLTAPEPLDVAWTSDNYHDYNDKFMGNPGPQVLARSAFKALKPGGLFIVIDHMAAAGRGMQDTETLHRIDRSTVIQQATAAGFRLAGESHVLNNVQDPLRIPVFDPKIRFHTSQFALKFRKPG
jgi:predicted methyltransferase